MPVIRRHGYLSEPQDEYLVSEAEHLGISVTELLRRIIDQHRDRSSNDADIRAREDAR